MDVHLHHEGPLPHRHGVLQASLQAAVRTSESLLLLSQICVRPPRHGAGQGGDQAAALAHGGLHSRLLNQPDVNVASKVQTTFKN